VKVLYTNERDLRKLDFLKYAILLRAPGASATENTDTSSSG
jgi:hypothetical protein